MKKITRSVLSVVSVGMILIGVAACGSSVGSLESGITLKQGKVVTFTNNEAGGPKNGWSFSDSSGTWSQSDKTILELNYDESFNEGMSLKLYVSAFVIDKNPNVSASISANGEFIKEVKFNLNKLDEDILLTISKEILSKNEGRVTLTFEITNAAVPKELGYNADERKVGIFLMKLTASPLV
jgi:hypothetical protein